ncbi:MULTISPECIES: response regulator [Psychrilyobacter]|uniref:histidine kinase n=1 Tax=Psychrilyobacter piezotolerans TaxID=2293438 RepID=A0ABX9KK16_9FUSO|nr:MULTISPECIES: response regulator [Psychrilyobacter]MCS5423090.1 response regulator [Psychrilyobacter sp. S5]NDI79289.1 response regulator [Psychrilyobacter piezotolerans]RDE65204.1 response regulator [Psychrilyobacter sp. S5]REI42774.1 response regulator [Psychrilyobacter piezotolerans]
MRIRDFKIGTTLLFSFSIILTLVAIIGLVAYSQTNTLQGQVETLYEHPLQVRRAIDNLKLNIAEQRINTKDLILEDNVEKHQEIIARAAVLDADIEAKFNTIEELYLGPSSDISDAYDAFVVWRVLREGNFDNILNGNTEEVIVSISPGGTEAIKRDDLLAKTELIDVFAQKKADELYTSSIRLHENMVLQLIIIVSAIFALTLIIGYWLYNSIRKPIFIMIDAVLKFQSGSMSSRITYKSKNEFGTLAYSINTMSDIIQRNAVLNQQTIQMSGKMMIENDAHEFFKVTLNSLADFSGAQIAAVYLLSEDNKTFRHFESMGLAVKAKEEFLINELEGEFGSVLLNKEIQHIREIPDDTRFVFNTVSGEFLPKEIITFPIQSNNQIIAIISLASINTFGDNAVNLIENIADGLTARIESIISENKVKEFMTELEQQSAELVEQNTKLEMQKKQLNEASNLKSNFLSNMSHELRTPLNSVIALSGVLSRRLMDKVPEEEYGYLEIISRNGKNLLDLLNDILDISRIESGYEEIDVTKFNANKLLNEIVEMLEAQANKKGIKLKHNKKSNKLIIISDYDKCLHILQNLVGNAVKFTEKGSVTIDASFTKDALEVKIIDTGIGISEEFLENIFDEFRQADGGTARKFGGTGLGLAIAKKYAELLGGTVTVQSEVGIGSTFTLIIPSAHNNYELVNSIKDENQYVAAKTLTSASNNSKKKTILLVEDNESAIIQIIDLVEGMGVEIISAENGELALEILEHTIPDAVILDLMMPKVNGFEVLESIRNNDSTASVPVLVLTAKHLNKEELINLKRINIHQLIQKGDIDRIRLQTSIFNMLFPTDENLLKKDSISKEGMPNILIVEDNPDNMITIKAILDGLYNIIEAKDGIEGIRKTKEHHPDLVLMDIALPGISGIEAFKEIRKISALRDIPIIAITASVMKEDREFILSQGFDGFIAKPIISEELFNAIGGVLDGTRKN